MRERVGYTIGSVLSIVGAFAIGAVLHGVFVQHSIAITDVTAILGIVAGFVVIGVGQSLERRTKNAVLPDQKEEGKEDERETFDEELAPLDESSLDEYERDDEYEQ